MATCIAETSPLSAKPISCHAVSPSGSLLAICPNGTEVILLEKSNGTWKVVCRLDGHDQMVSGLHFFQDAAGGLRLVSASHDRNSYVWTRQPSADNGSWSPELVITKLSRAGLCVQWAPDGCKFAIGSGEKSVCICYHDSERELWAPKLIKKQHGSSVTGVAWHPSGALLATTSTDRRCRVFNALVPDVDGADRRPAVLGSSRFGEPLLEAESGGWVLAVAWSPGGDTLAFSSQDSMLTLLRGLDIGNPSSFAGAAAAGGASGGAQRQQLQLPGLPLKCLAFLSDSVLVGAGFDFRPLVFVHQGPAGGEWQLVSLQPGSKKQPGGGGGPATRGASLSSRIKMFENQAAKQGGSSSRGAASAAGENGDSPSTDSSEEQPHSNCIMSVTPLPASSSGRLRFLTSGLDGRVVEWELEGL